MKSDPQNREPLVILLTKGFLMFAAAMLAATIFVFWISGQYYEKLREAPDVEGMLEDINLLNTNYEEINEEQYLGPDGEFAVVTYSGHMVYRSSEIIRAYFTTGELGCIETYGEESYVDYMSFSLQGGVTQYVFIKHSYTEQNEEVQQMMILDDAYHVISGGFRDGRQIYTPTEVNFLMGTVLTGYDYHKSYIPNSSLILITVTQTQDNDYYAALQNKSNKLFLLLIPLYTLVFLFMLIWMTRKINTPLLQLSQAISDFTVGDHVETGHLDGPQEIIQIGRNFDQMAEQLAESERQRDSLDKARQTLIADISHDLKTPITVISGYTQAIVDKKIKPEETGAYLDLVNNKAKELASLITTFHEYSKMEHPDFVLQTNRCDLCEFMRGYLADRYEEIDINGFELEALIPENEAYFCEIDENLMRRALDNIIYNSLRHNKKGTELVVSVFLADDGNICIMIADNGTGIPMDKRNAIFEPFVKGDASRTGRGSGLGLSISRKIIKEHGGSIRLCDSEQSSFSTEFEILLPEAEKES